jgi:hypothetical protein
MVQEVLGEPLLVLKGPEVAVHYPAAGVRPFGDLDLMVLDADKANRKLLESGFRFALDPARTTPNRHDSVPVQWPGIPLKVEIHRAPGWLPWMQPPTNAELFRSSVPSVTGVENAFALSPDHLALYLAVHSWRHAPFNRLLDMVDLALVRDGLDRDALNARAEAWGMGRVWRANMQMVDHLLFGEGRPPRFSTSLYARHLVEVRERNLVEWYLVWWGKGLAAPTPSAAARAVLSDVRFSLTAHPWQTPGSKVRRIGAALGRAFRPASDHRSR